MKAFLALICSLALAHAEGGRLSSQNAETPNVERPNAKH
jgi:hypothetical protein